MMKKIKLSFFFQIIIVMLIILSLFLNKYLILLPMALYFIALYITKVIENKKWIKNVGHLTYIF